MGNNGHEQGPMASASATPALSPRLAQARAFLSPLDPEQVAGVIAARIRESEGLPLPRLSRDERPVDIFVDIVEYGGDEALSTHLREAGARLLARMVEDSAGRNLLPNVASLSELCYLSARIGALDALESLRALSSREDAAVPTPASGEDLRLRALRCMVGLLGSHPDRSDRDRYREVLERCLDVPGYELIALTGLVGLWPGYKEVGRQGRNVDEKLLNTSLAVAGFR
jgi:hypothetical protein